MILVNLKEEIKGKLFTLITVYFGQNNLQSADLNFYDK